MGDLDSGLLTLLAFTLLAVFGIVAFFSLRKHMRGIQVPHEAEVGAAENGEPVTGVEPSAAGAETGADEVVAAETASDQDDNGKRSPKASSRS